MTYKLLQYRDAVGQIMQDQEVLTSICVIWSITTDTLHRRGETTGLSIWAK